MQEKVQRLAQERQNLAGAKAHKKELLDAFMQSDEMVAAAHSLSLAELEASIAKDEVDGAALRFFEDEGDKNPHPAVSIAMTKKFNYDNVDVLAWAMEHDLATLLSPVAKEVKALAKTGATDIPVTITEVPSTRIKSDLSDYLEES